MSGVGNRAIQRAVPFANRTDTPDESWLTILLHRTT
jgi:hypothetical protein